MGFSLDHIVIRSADVEGLLSFYSEVIGLGVENAGEFRRGEAFFPSLRVDPATIIDLLPQAEGTAAPDRCNMDHFCLVVDAGDWQPLLDRLGRAGVELEMGPLELDGARGVGTGVYIRDPDGNRVELRYYA